MRKEKGKATRPMKPAVRCYEPFVKYENILLPERNDNGKESSFSNDSDDGHGGAVDPG
jgi:hypothetical protein